MHIIKKKIHLKDLLNLSPPPYNLPKKCAVNVDAGRIQEMGIQLNVESL